MAKKLKPNHPGKHLAEFLSEYDISKYRLAKEIDVPLTRITSIVKGSRGITADTALRFGRYFGTTPEFWVNLQTNYDIKTASAIAGKAIKQIIPFAA